MLVDATVTKTVKILLTTLLFGIGLFVAYKLRSVIMWLTIGTFLAIIINPAVSKLTRYMPRKKRGFAVALVIALGAILIGFLISVFLPPLIQQSTELIQNWPEITEQFAANLETSDQAPYKFIRDHGLVDYFVDNKEEIKDGISSFFGNSLKKVFGWLSSIGALFTILAMMVYTSVNGSRYAQGAKLYLPKRHRKDIEQLVRQMYNAVTGYVNGNLLTSSFAGIAAGLIASILGLPYPALLGLIIGITDLIPMIGATLGATIVVIITLFTSTTDAVIMAIFFIIYQQIENYVIVPRVMSKTVDMSSFAVFLAALSGGILAGFVGALIAIPIGACLQILGKYALKRWFPDFVAATK